MKAQTVQGKVWVIKDSDANFIDNIDTDQIFHNAHLAVTDIDEMGQFAFGNLEGWEDFPTKVSEGDIIIVGENFGAGSSRQQAVDCFISLGVHLIIGVSFGAIYWRNAVNSGFPILKCPAIKSSQIETDDEIKIHLYTGAIENMRDDVKEFPQAEPFSKVQMEIYQAGSLFKLAAMKL